MVVTAPARKTAPQETQPAAPVPPPAAPEFVIRLLDPATLTAHPENWRRHPERQKEAIGASISEFGYLASVLWNERTGHLLDGHARVELALAQGTDRLPVRVIDVPETTERRILASFDRIGELRGQDDAALAALLSSLAEEGPLPPGWEQPDLNRLLARLGASGLLPGADPDALPEAAETRCQLGDLWQLGPHRLLCGDCTDAASVARLLGEEKPLLMATDPPYGVELDHEWRDRRGRNRVGSGCPSYLRRRRAGDTGSRSGDTVGDWSPGFALVDSLQIASVWHSCTHSCELRAGLSKIGFTVFQQISWDKGQAVMTRRHYWSQHEPCWYARKPKAPWYGGGGAAAATLWTAPSPKKIHAHSPEQRFPHPTQKPVELWRHPILNHTVPGEAVYEPFAGSGTALIAGEQHGRRCLALEIEPRFCDIILSRYEQSTGKEAERLEQS